VILLADKMTIHNAFFDRDFGDLDVQGRVVSITIEHASRQADMSDFTFERVSG